MDKWGNKARKIRRANWDYWTRGVTQIGKTQGTEQQMVKGMIASIKRIIDFSHP